jgi:glycosyltransferase involved in cell wall biosynthesis
MVGASNHPHSFYQNSKVFLITSDYEGFPLTLMEAISSGCFPVCRDLPEIKLFFDKYQNNIIFSSAAQASKLINNGLKDSPQNLRIKNYYKNKLQHLQQKNINRYVGYCLSG